MASTKKQAIYISNREIVLLVDAIGEYLHYLNQQPENEENKLKIQEIDNLCEDITNCLEDRVIQK